VDDKDNVTSVTCSMGHGQRLHLCDPVIHLVTNQVYMLSQHTLAILWNVLRFSLHQKLPNWWIKKQTFRPEAFRKHAKTIISLSFRGPRRI